MSDLESIDDELFAMLQDLEVKEDPPAQVISQIPPEPELITSPATSLPEKESQAELSTTVTIAATVDTDVSIGPPLHVKYLDHVDAIREEILQACRSDRQEAQEVITLMRSEIDQAIASGSRPERVYIEALVKAIDVKSSINTNAIKIVDSTAKMIAALKPSMGPQINVNNNNGGIPATDADLMKILSEPLTPTDEY